MYILIRTYFAYLITNYNNIILLTKNELYDIINMQDYTILKLTATYNM